MNFMCVLIKSWIFHSNKKNTILNSVTKIQESIESFLSFSETVTLYKEALPQIPLKNWNWIWQLKKSSFLVFCQDFCEIQKQIRWESITSSVVNNWPNSFKFCSKLTLYSLYLLYTWKTRCNSWGERDFSGVIYSFIHFSLVYDWYDED